MKTLFISDLRDGQAVAATFLVRSKEIRTSPRTSRSWLQLELADRTGTISGKMWDGYEAMVTLFDRDDVVKIRARAKLYNDQLELTVEHVAPCSENDYELADFLPHTKQDVEKLYAHLNEAVHAVENPWIKTLLVSVVEDASIAPKMKRAPAAMTMHHAYIGGLLEHVVSLIDLMRLVSSHYPELNRDILLAGVVLHDIGKIEELSCARGFGYTTEGQLLGHIALGQAIVRRKIDAISEFPRPLATVIEHLILSHHGQLEFGSPKLPLTREAVALNFLDDLDSKMAAIETTMASDAGSGDWTERNPALRRNLLRTSEYIDEPVAETRAKPASTAASASAAKGDGTKG